MNSTFLYVGMPILCVWHLNKFSISGGVNIAYLAGVNEKVHQKFTYRVGNEVTELEGRDITRNGKKNYDLIDLGARLDVNYWVNPFLSVYLTAYQGLNNVDNLNDSDIMKFTTARIGVKINLVREKRDENILPEDDVDQIEETEE